MDIKLLNSKWENISSFKEYKGFKSLRITAECIPDLFIANDEDGYRCLILFVPENLNIEFIRNEKEKLTLEYLNQKNLILIRLNDLDFIDLFDDLIVSLYHKIYKISNPDFYVESFVEAFNKWAEFFSDKIDYRLSDAEIRGLFGELHALKSFFENLPFNDVNDLLKSWRGPYGNTNDFVFENKNVEVKTHLDSKEFIRISSEYQLENEFEKDLELLIVSLKVDLIEGETMYDLLRGIVGQVRKHVGDLSILYKALNQKGLSLELSKNYNNHRFIIIKDRLYNCMGANFPKLAVSNIPNGISRLKYKLKISAIREHLIEEIKYLE